MNDSLVDPVVARSNANRVNSSYGPDVVDVT